MNPKTKFVLSILLTVLLFIGVYLLYDNLSGQFATDRLMTQSGQTAQAEGTQPDNVPVDEESADESLADNTQPGDAPTDAATPTDLPPEEPEMPKAPDFTVVNAAGESVNLSDYYGKPVVVNFWASWCGPCKMEMPDFQKAYETYGEDVHFLMVNLTDGGRETVETASKYIADQGFTFPVLFDVDSDAAITYGVASIPTTYFMDAEGYGVAWASGALDMATIERGIGMITE